MMPSARPIAHKMSQTRNVAKEISTTVGTKCLSKVKTINCIINNRKNE